MQKNLIVNLDEDYPEPVGTPLWGLFLFFLVTIVGFFIATILVCALNVSCRELIPTLNNLLDSPLVAPFVIIAINTVLLLYWIVGMGIYFMTRERSPYWSKLQLLSSYATLFAVILTLFVFPFTSWNKNYANYLLILIIGIWMFFNLMCLKQFYRHEPEKRILICHFAIWILYIFTSGAYAVLRIFFQQNLSAILAIEICNGLAIVAFLAVAVFCIWKMKIIIKF